MSIPIPFEDMKEALKDSLQNHHHHNPDSRSTQARKPRSTSPVNQYFGGTHKKTAITKKHHPYQDVSNQNQIHVVSPSSVNNNLSSPSLQSKFTDYTHPAVQPSPSPGIQTNFAIRTNIEKQGGGKFAGGPLLISHEEIQNIQTTITSLVDNTQKQKEELERAQDHSIKAELELKRTKKQLEVANGKISARENDLEEKVSKLKLRVAEGDIKASAEFKARIRELDVELYKQKLINEKARAKESEVRDRNALLQNLCAEKAKENERLVGLLSLLTSVDK